MMSYRHKHTQPGYPGYAFAIRLLATSVLCHFCTAVFGKLFVLCLLLIRSPLSGEQTYRIVPSTNFLCTLQASAIHHGQNRIMRHSHQSRLTYQIDIAFMHTPKKPAPSVNLQCDKLRDCVYVSIHRTLTCYNSICKCRLSDFNNFFHFCMLR